MIKGHILRTVVNKFSYNAPKLESDILDALNDNKVLVLYFYQERKFKAFDNLNGAEKWILFDLESESFIDYVLDSNEIFYHLKPTQGLKHYLAVKTALNNIKNLFKKKRKGSE